MAMSSMRTASSSGRVRLSFAVVWPAGFFRSIGWRSSKARRGSRSSARASGSGPATSASITPIWCGCMMPVMRILPPRICRPAALASFWLRRRCRPPVTVISSVSGSIMRNCAWPLSIGGTGRSQKHLQARRHPACRSRASARRRTDPPTPPGRDRHGRCARCRPGCSPAASAARRRPCPPARTATDRQSRPGRGRATCRR